MADVAAYMRDSGRYSLTHVLTLLQTPPDAPPTSAAHYVSEVSRAVAVELYRDRTITRELARSYGERECLRLYPRSQPSRQKGKR
jgi:hypothetical protein